MMGKKTRTKNSFLLLVLLFSASCSQIKIQTPSSRFSSPEVQGKLFTGSFRMEQSSGAEGTLDFDGDNTDNPLLLRKDVSTLGLNVDIGLIEKIDLSMHSTTYTPTVYTVKYQILGDARLKAQKGNKSLAISFGYGSQEQSQTKSDFDIFSSSSAVSADIVNNMYEFSVLYGFRPESDILLYTSAQATKHDIDFKLSSDTSSALNGESFSLNTWAYGLSLGAIRYFDKYYLNAEISAQKTDWTNNDPKTFAYANLALGYRWE